MAAIVIDLVPVLNDNYAYLVHDVGSGATAAIDPGAAGPVLARAATHGWRLTHAIATHHHADHVGGIPDLVRETGCAVVGAARDSARLPPLDVEAGEGDTLMLGASALVVLATPGHTDGHLAFWFREAHAVFTGDCLFSLGCGRLFEGTAEQMWASLLKLRDLPGETRLYCGHEYTAANGRFARLVERDNPALLARLAQVETLRAQGRPTVPVTIAEERATNPFLRADVDSVARAVGMSPGSPAGRVLAELRRRKDVF